MSNGSAIAAEVQAALVEAAIATGEGPLAGTLSRDGAILDETTYPPTPGTATDYPCTVLLGRYTARDREGTNIQVGDQRALVASSDLAVVPRSGDRLTVKGVAYDVVDLSILQPGGVPLYYDLQVRGQ